VEGCKGAGGQRDVYARDICAPGPLILEHVGSPCTDYFSSGKCNECTGDCNNDSDCYGNLRCAHRFDSVGGQEDVPGCAWSGTERFAGTDFCFQPVSQPGTINYVGECGDEEYLCGLCEGDCDDDSDCQGDLVCFQRDGYEPVEGCKGAGGQRDVYAKDVCVPDTFSPAPTSSPSKAPTKDPTTAPTLVPTASTPLPTNSASESLTVEYMGSPCTDYFSSGQCNECTGDCNSDSDCAGDLRCAFRSFSSGIENVPGCSWSGTERFPGIDFCFMPISQPDTINYVGECSPTTYACARCEGDCDSDSDCQGDLICFQRDGYEPVEGCKGEGGGRDLYARDVCVPDTFNPLPTKSPTKAPTIVRVCESIFPTEYILSAKFGNTNYCYRIQTHDGGKLSVDTQDTGCANLSAGHTYRGGPISSYKRTNPSCEAVYEGVWSGSIALREDSSLSVAKFEVSGNTNTKIFAGTLTVPTCSTRSVCTSISPGEYTLPARFGMTFYCYRIQVMESGKLSVNTKDTGCANFNAGGGYDGFAISTYEGITTDGQALYEGEWSGSISLVQDTSLSAATFEISGNSNTKEFSGILAVPSCGDESENVAPDENIDMNE